MSIEVELGQNCSVCGINNSDVDDVWNDVVPLIERALARSRGEFTVDDVRYCLTERLMQLWVAHNAEHKIEACLVTQLAHYPRRKFLRIIALGGKHSSHWDRGIELVFMWARSLGCDGVESFSRPGIARLYKKFGFRSYYSVVGLDFQPLDVH